MYTSFRIRKDDRGWTIAELREDSGRIASYILCQMDGFPNLFLVRGQFAGELGNDHGPENKIRDWLGERLSDGQINAVIEHTRRNPVQT